MLLGLFVRELAVFLPALDNIPLGGVHQRLGARLIALAQHAVARFVVGVLLERQ